MLNFALAATFGALGAAVFFFNGKRKEGMMRAPLHALQKNMRSASFRTQCSTQAAGTQFVYRYPRPGLTVDTIIVSQPQVASLPKLLLIKRKYDPFKDAWALPGGFVDENESLETAAARELQEETSVDPSSVQLTQVGAFGDPGRDPRGWTVTVAFLALVPSTDLGVKAADDAKEARWFDVTALPRLAFDHKLVVRTAFEVLAKLPEAAGNAKLQEQLQHAVTKLAGPWQQQNHA